MDEPSLHHVECIGAGGLHRMAYWSWGDAANPRVLVCVHGLTRQGRDFDTLAQDLCGEYRVVCPDVVGRGRSDWLPEPMGYIVPSYVADMVTLIARLGVPQVDWVGTSMGGLIGIGVASLPAVSGNSSNSSNGSNGSNGGASLVRQLVINDVGPTIEPAGLQRIGSYVGRPTRWRSVEEAADALWSISTGFGPHTRDEWLALTRPQLMADDNADGPGVKPRSDPAIGVPFKSVTPEMAAAGEALMWQAWDRLTMPTLLLRGAESDLLSRATAEQMSRRGPRARVQEFAGVGHAPTLIAADQRAAVRGFLLAA